MTTDEILKNATPRPWDEYTLCALVPQHVDEVNEELAVLAVNAYEADRAEIATLRQSMIPMVQRYEADRALIGQLVEALENLMTTVAGEQEPGGVLNLTKAMFAANAALAAAKERQP